MHVADALCAGDPSMGQRLLTAVRAAAEAGDDARAIRLGYGTLARHCTSDRMGEWAATALASAHTPVERGVLWHLVAACGRTEDARALMGVDVPDSATVAWMASDALPTVAAQDVDRAAAAIVAEARADPERLEVLMAARTLLMDHPVAGMAALEALRDQMPERLAAELSDPPTLAPTEPIETAEAFVRMPYLVEDGASTWLATHGDQRDDLVSGLKECAAGDGFVATSCLRHLSAVAPELAADVARAKLPSAEGPDRETAASIAAFPSTTAVDATLRERGWVPRPGYDTDPQTTLADTLEAWGRLSRFDTETGSFPNQHDSLLRELAGLAGPSLDGALFLESPPPADDGSANYRLTAWMNGREYAVQAHDFGDWYDLGAVIGLLNDVARDGGLEARFVALATGDQTARVVAGPRDALVAVLAEGLLVSASPSDAARAGKLFEETVSHEVDAPSLE